MLELKTIGAKDLDKILTRYQKFLKHPTGFYRTASSLMYRDVIQHFDREQGEGGKPWKPLRESTLLARSMRRKKRTASSLILKDTGRLRQSIQSDYSDGNAKVGTNIVYGATHNYGDNSRNIPERKFLWLSKRSVNAIFKAFEKELFIEGRIALRSKF